ncbi:hypothetical protein GKC56_00835 [Neisseriaceae bacterium PsAf]|nr:hypothetical protein [Neisseriaceae bacterium PsAf]MCV2503505.1 hypothetical protein [Neisseriaceae bacterium]
MNKKAELLKDFLKENKLLDSFEVSEVGNNVTIFRSVIELGDDKYNIIVGVDDSPYTIIRTFFGKDVGIVNAKNSAEKIFKLNRENDVLKFYKNEDGELIMDIVLPTPEQTFDPAMIQAFLALVVQHLPKIYPEIK